MEKTINWIQVIASVPENNVEALEEAMIAAEAAAVTCQDAQDQAILEPELGTTPLWSLTTVTGLFNADEDMDTAIATLKAVYREMSQTEAPEIRTEILENEDWTRKWIENFKPIKFGNRLWVCPSWSDVPDPNAINLLLDPGLAFGTGTHPTTSLCLRWLDHNDLSGKVLIDFGCGSGILGIAALLLGAKHVVAIDNDPQALQATAENAKRNNIPLSKLDMCLPDNVPDIEADILVANILAKPLMELRDTMLQMIKPGAPIVLSGVLQHQADELIDCYCDKVLMDEPVFDGDWARLSGHVKSDR